MYGTDEIERRRLQEEIRWWVAGRKLGQARGRRVVRHGGLDWRQLLAPGLLGLMLIGLLANNMDTVAAQTMAIAAPPGAVVTIDGQPNDGSQGEGDNVLGIEDISGGSGSDVSSPSGTVRGA